MTLFSYLQNSLSIYISFLKLLLNIIIIIIIILIILIITTFAISTEAKIV